MNVVWFLGLFCGGGLVFCGVWLVAFGVYRCAFCGMFVNELRGVCFV